MDDYINVPISPFFYRITMKPLLLVLFLSHALCFPFYAQMITQPQVWLRGDDIGENRSLWNNQGESGILARYSGNAFTVSDSGLNYNPAIFLDGTGEHFQLGVNPEIAEELTVFSVFVPGDDVERMVWSGTNCRERKLYQSTAMVLGPNEIMDWYGPVENTAYLMRVVQQWGPPKEDASENAAILIGAPDNGNHLLESFKGQLAEFILFERSLSETERVQVETYLALKYGITLKDINYVDSGEEVLWSRRENGDFSHRIAGIGRDDKYGLNQKQSTSSSGDGLLSIGFGSIQATNQANLEEIEDRNFLLWGDDALGLGSKMRNEIPIPALERNWLMRATRIDHAPRNTQVLVDRSQSPFSENETMVLVIDRSGNGTYQSTSIEYIEGKAVPGKGVVSFSPVQWDPDGSGKDVFTFASVESLTLIADLIHSPDCENPERGEVKLNVLGGNGTYKYQLSDVNGRKMEDWIDGPVSYVKGLQEGEYEIRVFGDEDLTTSTTVSIDVPELFTIRLGEPQRSVAGEVTTLDISSQLPLDQDFSLNWVGPNGYHSNLSKIDVSDPGTYDLEVVSSEGCKTTATFQLLDLDLMKFEVYPSLVYRNDIPVILAEFSEPTVVSFEVSDAGGKVIHEWKDQGKTQYVFEQPLYDAGVYFVLMRTPDNEYVKKVVVTE